jgi:uncharacterized hydrophobic protein (TIGR00341 family)
MVIAPLLKPNVALTLASTLGDIPMAIRSSKALIVGIAVAMVTSIAIGFFIHVDPETPEIASRTDISMGHIILALAAGCAGGLAYTTALPSALIGVMVAVALLPPLVVFGLLAGAAHISEAIGALMLFLANLICINLAGVVTFLAQGIRPRTWWEKEKAKKAVRTAILLWIAALAILVIVILLWWEH